MCMDLTSHINSVSSRAQGVVWITLGRSICGVLKLWCYITVMVLSPILIRITDVS